MCFDDKTTTTTTSSTTNVTDQRAGGGDGSTVVGAGATLHQSDKAALDAFNKTTGLLGDIVRSNTSATSSAIERSDKLAERAIVDDGVETTQVFIKYGALAAAGIGALYLYRGAMK